MGHSEKLYLFLGSREIRPVRTIAAPSVRGPTDPAWGQHDWQDTGHPGEITGSQMLYIYGQVEGTVRMPGNRVIVVHNARVKAKMTAREVVVQGNMEASDRANVRSDGPLTLSAGTCGGGVMIGPAYIWGFVPVSGFGWA
ncbi:MAG: polymer-forming cytoskeletal protein [Acidobacteriaceae bacterium]